MHHMRDYDFEHRVTVPPTKPTVLGSRDPEADRPGSIRSMRVNADL